MTKDIALYKPFHDQLENLAFFLGEIQKHGFTLTQETLIIDCLKLTEDELIAVLDLMNKTRRL